MGPIKVEDERERALLHPQGFDTSPLDESIVPSPHMQRAARYGRVSSDAQKAGEKGNLPGQRFWYVNLSLSAIVVADFFMLLSIILVRLHLPPKDKAIKNPKTQFILFSKAAMNFLGRCADLVRHYACFTPKADSISSSCPGKQWLVSRQSLPARPFSDSIRKPLETI